MALEADAFSVQLLEEAKRFLEIARDAAEPTPYLHASLLLTFSSFESHLNGLSDELSLRQDTGLLDKALLFEQGLTLKAGAWGLSSGQHFYRLEDRLQFLFRRYGDRSASDESWWSTVCQAIQTRNALVHPREVVSLDDVTVARYLASIVEALNALYLVVFKRGHPAYGRGVQSTLTF